MLLLEGLTQRGRARSPLVRLMIYDREVFRLPARTDLTHDSVPPWVAEVEHEMVEAQMDWELLSRDGPAWMSYWDQHVRGTGKK